MQSTHDRLTIARQRRFTSGRQAAAALGLSPYTYAQYENGSRGFTRHAERFARFFRVDLGWLLTGKGEITGRTANADIPLMGIVGAGATVVPIAEDEAAINLGEITLPECDEIAALMIKGDSGYPRFQDGEIIIYYTRQLTPSELVNKTAIVQTLDGRRMIKKVRRLPSQYTYTLESFNAPPESGVELLCGWLIHSIIVR
jgi:transcriptional regulator with XRE-family HTH domain